MAKEKKIHIQRLYDAADKRNFKRLEGLVEDAAKSMENPAEQITAEGWKAAGEVRKQKLNQRKKLKTVAIAAVAILFSLVLVVSLVLLIGKYYSTAPTIMPTPTLLPEGEGVIDATKDDKLTQPIISEKTWLIDKEMGLNKYNDVGLNGDEDSIMYIGAGGKLTVSWIKEHMNNGLYQICYFDPQKFSDGVYEFVVTRNKAIVADPVLGNGKAYLNYFLNEDSRKESTEIFLQDIDYWSCFGFYSIEHDDTLEVKAEIGIPTEDEVWEFPFSNFLLMRMSEKDTSILSELEQLIEADSEIIEMRILLDNLPEKYSTGNITDGNKKWIVDGNGNHIGINTGGIIFTADTGEVEYPPDEKGFFGNSVDGWQLNPLRVDRIRYLQRITPQNGTYNLAVYVPEENAEGLIQYDLIKPDDISIPNNRSGVLDQSIYNGEWVVIGEWTIADDLNRPRAVYIQATAIGGQEMIPLRLDAIALLAVAE